MLKTVELNTIEIADKLNEIAERVHLVRLAVTGLEGDDSDPIERELYRIIEDIRSISDEVHPPLTAKAIAKIRREAGVEA